MAIIRIVFYFVFLILDYKETFEVINTIYKVEEEKVMENKEDISNAFGNEIEDVKANEETVDQKNEMDSKDTEEHKESKTEHENVPSNDKSNHGDEKKYTQAQVDAMMARMRKKYTKGANDENRDEQTKEDVNQQESDANKAGDNTRDLSTGITVERLAQAELKAEMAICGINPQKIARAVRLVDVADCLDETGEYNQEKAQEAINSLIQDWPELKQVQQQDNTFEFGAPGQEEHDQNTEKSMISKIFGN